MAPPGDFGYMEGDQLGKPYDLRLLARLAGYARPVRGCLLLTALLTLLSAGLDLLAPYFTRLAIDDHLLRQAVRVELAAAPSDLAGQLAAAAGPDLLADGRGGGFLAEPVWRRLDPRLIHRLRTAGVVETEPWYLAPPGETAERLAAAHPAAFRRAADALLLPRAELGRLPAGELAALRAPDLSGLAVLALLYALAALLSFGLGWLAYVLLERAGQRIMLELRRRLIDHILGRALPFFARQPVGKLVTRLTNDVANLNEMFRNLLVAFCVDLFSLLGIVGLLIWLDWGLALWCLALVPLIAGLAWLFAHLARDAFRAMQGHLGRINSFLAETLAGLAVVKLFRAEAKGEAEFTRLNQAYYRAGLRQVWIFAGFMPLADLFASLAVGLLIWHGGGLVVQDRLSLGTLVAFLFYMQKFFAPIRDLAEKYNVLQAAMASAERIFHLLDDPESLPLPANPRRPTGAGEVRFETVTFGYRPGVPVLKELSLTIPAGRSWAVVGPTGAGKSTLVNLVLRLHDPQAGRVLLDGVDLRELDEAARARAVALVPQEVFILAASLEDNLRLGREWITPAMLVRALEVSGRPAGRGPAGGWPPPGRGGARAFGRQRQLLAWPAPWPAITGC